MTDIAVLGGGAAGMAAALEAAGKGKRVTLLEAGTRTGRKISVSGNGRCNLMNKGALSYYGDAAFAAQVLSSFTQNDVETLLRSTGLMLSQEEDGRVYPSTFMSASVLDAFRAALDRENVIVLCEHHVKSIVPGKDAFELNLEESTITAKKVICALGSPAGGKLGRDSYSLLKNLGHTLIPPLPALSPLLCDMTGLSALKGLRVRAVVTLLLADSERDKAQAAESANGEILFSESGISGVCAMQLARSAAFALRHGKRATLAIDFSPMLGLFPLTHFHVSGASNEEGLSAASALLEARQAIFPREALLTGLVPKALADVITKRASSPEALARQLSCFLLPIRGVKGMDACQVAAGGMDTREFDPRTMMSTRIPGLYAAGEMLNVDGDCGGYNLMFAFASGALAGISAADALSK